MRVVWNTLSVLACLLGYGATGAGAQDASSFVVDGDWRDWGGGGPGEGDELYDVAPDSNNTIDIITYAYGHGSFGERQLFTFIFRFLEAPFQGSSDTSVQLFFDVSADTTQGEAQPPWVGFLPEYQIEIVGRDGGLTRQIHRRLAGDEWVVSEGEDIAEVEAALSGEWLEGAVPWPALGDPGTTAEEEERGYWHFKWTVRTGQDGSHDYVPDGTSYPGVTVGVPWEGGSRPWSPPEAGGGSRMECRSEGPQAAPSRASVAPVPPPRGCHRRSFPSGPGSRVCSTVSPIGSQSASTRWRRPTSTRSTPLWKSGMTPPSTASSWTLRTNAA